MPTEHHEVSGHYGRLLGLKPPWTVESVSVDGAASEITVRIGIARGSRLPCPECGRPCPVHDRLAERSWRHLDTMQFVTTVRCRVPRASCPEHGVSAAAVPWAEPRSRWTLAFERHAVAVIRSSRSLSGAGSLLRISWHRAHAIVRRSVERGVGRRSASPMPHAGMDEKSFGGGHDYVSVLTDVDAGSVFDVVRGRTREAADALWASVPEARRATVEAVAMDMWDAFMGAAAAAVPGAEVVHDRFHASAYLGKAVDSVRRGEARELRSAGDRSLVGTRYVWLTAPGNWSEAQSGAFAALAAADLKTGRAWAAKESFRRFWAYSSAAWARRFFDAWYFRATHSRLKPLVEAARTLKRHLPGLLAYFRHRITNAATEGLNSVIQSIKSNARGFRNFDNYRAAILFHCGKLDLLPH